MSESNGAALSLSNLLRPEIRANPYPLYARLRAEDPVHWDEAMGFWVITRNADVSSIYRDSRFSRALGLAGAFRRLPAGERERTQPLYESFSKAMPYTDPPYHTRLRGLANKAFTPRVVAQMRPHIQKVLDGLLDAVQDGGRMDVMETVAYPLPVTVIMELLGLPLEQRPQLKEWSNDVFATIGVVRHDPQVMTRGLAGLERATDFFRQYLDQVEKEPKSDLFSALAMVVEEGNRLTREELYANILVLLAAGHETTANLIGNGTHALLTHPDQMQLLRDDPALIANAVEEMLRYDNPAQVAYRVAAEDVEVGGKTIRRGEIVNLMLGAANRDPEHFHEPDRFDIRRPEIHQIGFGAGIHYCIGAPLARLEGQIAFSTFLRRFPNMHLETDKLEWQDHPTFRGLVSLPVVL